MITTLLSWAKSILYIVFMTFLLYGMLNYLDLKDNKYVSFLYKLPEKVGFYEKDEERGGGGREDKVRSYIIKGKEYVAPPFKYAGSRALNAADKIVTGAIEGTVYVSFGLLVLYLGKKLIRSVQSSRKPHAHYIDC